MPRSRRSSAASGPHGAPALAARVWLAAARERWYQPVFLFPAALLLAGLVTWPYLPRWTPDLSSDPNYQLTSARLLLPPAHRWVPNNLASRVLERLSHGPSPDSDAQRDALPADSTIEGGGPSLRERRTLSLLSPGLAERIARELAQEPWVREVLQVSQNRDGTVTADVSYRTPQLMVATPRGMYAIDSDCVLLPPEDFTAADIPLFPQAAGITTLPRVGAGQRWEDVRLAGAARLAMLLTQEHEGSIPWDKLNLAQIIVPPLAEDAPSAMPLPYVLVTRGGSRILWGRPPGEESVEPPPEQKLGRLLYYFEQCGGFETAQGPSRIDIREVDAIYAGLPETGRR